MKITVLLDNNALIDKYLLSEPALSLFIECDGKTILFDTGYSDAFLINANKLNLEIRSLDYIVISHGHNDHTGGLEYLTKLYSHYNNKKPVLLAHPLFINRKLDENVNIGLAEELESLEKSFSINLSKEPVWITENLVFLGEIPRKNDFEETGYIGRVEIDGSFKKDEVIEDSALVFKSYEGLVIITGCSHSGIANIIEYAKVVCNQNNINNVIGGFHLLGKDDEYLLCLSNYFVNAGIKDISPCHCTDLQAKIALSKNVKVKEVGTGCIFDFI